MDIQTTSLIAGTISSLIFASSNVPMLWKAYKTRDLRSYSLLNIILVNAGNLLHWFYVVNLPLGPIWILHTFYTISSAVLLVLYARYNLPTSTGGIISRLWAHTHGILTLHPWPHLDLRSSHHCSICQG